MERVSSQHEMRNLSSMTKHGLTELDSQPQEYQTCDNVELSRIGKIPVLKVGD